MNARLLDDFACKRCSACCRVEGYVTLEPGEAERLSAFLGMSVTDFTQQYTRLKHSRDALSLTEADDGACVLLEADGSCRVQPVKPQQCIDFPHKWITPTLKKTCPALKELFSK